MKRNLLSLFFMLSTVAHAADPVTLKNGREIFASLVNITGVSAMDPDVTESYRQNKDRLPKAGVPDDLNNTVVLAMTELGGLFCSKVIAREKVQTIGLRKLFSDVHFNRGPDQFDDYVGGQLINRLAKAFWFREAKPSEMQNLLASVNSVKATMQGTPDETLQVLQIVCSTFASSLAFLVK